MENSSSLRINAIDILRAITMVLMIFVNDLWSLTNIPAWLEHVPASYDGMGLADTVFPAFLFIVGMSIPFSVRNRKEKGESLTRTMYHVLLRSVALILMGVYLVNGENINAAGTGMARGVWNSLCCISFILIWNHYPASVNKWIVRTLKAAGILILLILAFIYRGGDDDHINRFATYWWGILGLIGWAYLVSATIYTCSGKLYLLPLFGWIFFMLLCIASHSGWIDKGSIVRTILSPLGTGAMPAFTLGGIIVSQIFLHFRKEKKDTMMTVVLVCISVLFFLSGILTRSIGGISKIRATPSWVFICSAITIMAFLTIYWITDRNKKAHAFNIIKPAGTNTLLCYLLPYFAYALVVLMQLSLPTFLLSGGIGLIKSLCFALLIVTVTGLLGRIGIRLKL